MPNITYIAENFTPSWGQALQGQKNLACTWSEIIWAGITVGKANWNDVWRFGGHSRLEAIFRMTMIYATLMEDIKSNGIVQTSAFSNMDPSEKTSISYFQGLMITKLMASRLLNVPWIGHFDLYKAGLNCDLVNNLKPDFIGVDINRRWIILEAKGRSNGFNREAIDKGKKQTRGLRKIEGQFPNLRAVIQSYFTKNGHLQARIVDPEEYEENAPDLDISLDGFVLKYYRFILNLIEDHHNEIKEEKINGITYLMLSIDEIDITIGINKKIHTMLVDGNSANIDRINAKQIMKILIDSSCEEQDDIFVGSDGIIVRTGQLWSKELMKVQPYIRGKKLHSN